VELPEGYDLRHPAAKYFAAVTWMDHPAGRILDTVAGAGPDGDTPIVFTSDHGENLGGHGLVRKGTGNDGSLRIALVMAGPKQAFLASPTNACLDSLILAGFSTENRCPVF